MIFALSVLVIVLNFLPHLQYLLLTFGWNYIKWVKYWLMVIA